LSLFLPIWQPFHLLLLSQIPAANKRTWNEPPEVLAAGLFPKKKETMFSKELSQHTLKE